MWIWIIIGACVIGAIIGFMGSNGESKMKRANSLTLCVLALLSLLLNGCSNSEQSESKHVNSIYHWKNFMSLSDYECQFLSQHNVGRIYVRFFDVTSDYSHGAVPSAQVYISDGLSLKDMEVVPTVFITLEALKEMQGREKEFAKKIYDRLLAQIIDAQITNVPEFQIDCDWTQSTQDSYFLLCKELGERVHADNRLLSSTIRLHQLSQEAPPVDRGVLMVYNVGDVKRIDETNSILRTDIIKRYLSNAPKYKLVLDVAYPVFSWGVVFRDGVFNRLTRIAAPIDSVEGLRHLQDNVYEVFNLEMADNYLSADYHDTMRYEHPDSDTIFKVKEMVEDYLGYQPAHTILYSLDENNLKLYSSSEIDKIYE